ncbi:hypothetical protein PRZ48_004810 [Zasmidium cellare]|uniref:Uncharacterized protein n=1 Tax=Zasmidium cellare TaxID=395010 RepID=A0ABR0ERX9_ZASCE|nr:hypothetical protein PRZ48_004810 [Zasmidium cellare]
MAREKQTAHPAPWVKTADHKKGEYPPITKTSTTASETFIIRKERLNQLMVEIAMGINPDLRVEALAVEALRAAGELFLWDLCATHNGRVFLSPEEYKLAKRVSKQWTAFAE